jgi:hypothetical protein
MQSMMIKFVETAEKVRASKSDDGMGAMNELIRQFLDAGRNKKNI